MGTLKRNVFSSKFDGYGLDKIRGLMGLESFLRPLIDQNVKVKKQSRRDRRSEKLVGRIIAKERIAAERANPNLIHPKYLNRSARLRLALRRAAAVHPT